MAAVGWTPGRVHGFGRAAGDGIWAQGHRRYPDRSAGVTPPGWPEEVRPPHSPGWEGTAAAFLFDCCPADYRSYPVLRRYPVVLARFAAEHVEAQIHGCREGIGGMRVSLTEYVGPEVLEQALSACHEQEALLWRRRREVALVEQALRGRVFVPKL